MENRRRRGARLVGRDHHRRDHRSILEARIGVLPQGGWDHDRYTPPLSSGPAVFGKADGTPVELADIAAGSGGFVINGIDPGDVAGSVSGAGDVNGDGLADVIVGAHRADPGGNGNAGESYVVFSPVVRGDLDGDGLVGMFDLEMLLDAWGRCPKPCVPYCPGDLDQSCSVSTSDLLNLLANWG